MTKYPNKIINIDRRCIEVDLRNIKSDLLDENGNLDDPTFDTIAQTMTDNIYDYIRNCYAKVERDIARFERNIGARDSNPHYRLYSRWDKKDYELDGIFTNLSDARETIRETKIEVSAQYEYKITEVKNGIEGTKNFYQPTLF